MKYKRKLIILKAKNGIDKSILLFGESQNDGKATFRIDGKTESGELLVFTSDKYIKISPNGVSSASIALDDITSAGILSKKGVFSHFGTIKKGFDVSNALEILNETQTETVKITEKSTILPERPAVTEDIPVVTEDFSVPNNPPKSPYMRTYPYMPSSLFNATNDVENIPDCEFVPQLTAFNPFKRYFKSSDWQKVEFKSLLPPDMNFYYLTGTVFEGEKSIPATAVPCRFMPYIRNERQYRTENDWFYIFFEGD